MFRFEFSDAFYLMVLVPILLFWYYRMQIRLKSRISAFGKSELINKMMPYKSDKKAKWKYFLEVAAIFFIVFSLSNPQWGTRKEKVKVEKSDIYIALDISNSMNTQDISPSRMERAKKFAEGIINNHRSDQIGLVLFAGSAYLQMPLTSDYAAALMFVRAVNTEMAGTQGTDIASAIELVDGLKTQTDHQRAMVIISDGEDHEELNLQAAQNAVKNGMIIFTVGVGTEEGGFVPAMQEGRQGFKIDEEGNPVRSQLNIGMLQELAAAGNGDFYLIGEGSEAINDLKSKLERVQKREVDKKSFTEYNSYFQYLLAIALLILLSSFYITTIKSIKA